MSKHTYAHSAELIIGLGKTLLEESWLICHCNDDADPIHQVWK